MIRSITAYTTEIDDAEQAAADITSALDLSKLLKNTVGIIVCHNDFVDSGAAEAVCAALPFPTVGVAALAGLISSSADNLENFLLSVLVLTSDDADFSVGLTEPIESAETFGNIDKIYKETAGKLSGPPKLVLSYLPLGILTVSSDEVVRKMDTLTGRATPNFGSYSSSANLEFTNAFIIVNGKHYRDRYAFVLISGEVNPRFFCAAAFFSKNMPKKGLVTRAVSNMIQEINNKPPIEYLKEAGVCSNAEEFNASAVNFPILVDYNDGSNPVMRGAFHITEEGHIFCAAEVPQDSTISISIADTEGILRSFDEVIDFANSAGEASAVLIYSCIGRYWMLQTDYQKEMSAALERIKPSFQLAYSGTEICPVAFEGSDKTANRSHNITCVVCAL
ncbi:MAG: FIST C-terminal domain-containing protein [Clostridiales bacterium]|jgi:hypothetical protein|nr:FIST C-terminal domain-containing protein [Clostridiales bacterium]